MSYQPKITGIQLGSGKAWPNGDTLLATFDCRVGGFCLIGCSLVRTSRGKALAQPPRGDSGRKSAKGHPLRAIQIEDDELRTALADAALAAFKAMGGEE